MEIRTESSLLGRDKQGLPFRCLVSLDLVLGGSISPILSKQRLPSQPALL